jgi:hypothetical protein
MSIFTVFSALTGTWKLFLSREKRSQHIL